MGKSGGQAEAAAARRHGPNGPDVVTAGATLGGGGSAGVPSVRERLRSHDLAVKVFVAGGTYVALSWVNQGWAVVGAVLSPVVSDLIRDYVRRHEWSLRRLRRGAAATVLLGHEEDEYAARRRARVGWRSRAPISLVAGAATVAAVVSAVALAAVGDAAPPDRPHGSQPPPVDHVPAQVAGVHGTSPTTKAPVIEWGAVQGAHRYIVFRNGHRVGVRTGRRFVDRTAAHGVLTYTVAAEAGGRTGQPSTGRTIVYQAATPPQADIRLTPTSTPNDPPSFWWDPVARADRYVVYRDGRPIDEIRTAGTRYTDLGVGRGVYEYQVAWMHGRTESLRSAPVRIVYEPVQPGVTPPGVTPPTGLAGTSPTADLPSLDWNGVDGADSYTVYRDNEPVGHPSEPSFTDRGIGAAGTYTYTVTATSGGVESGHSSSVDIRYVPALGAPTGFSGPATFTYLPIVLTWDRVDGARGYVVSRDGAALHEIRGTTFRDGDATPADHTYTVATVNAIGVQGDQSDPVYVTYVPPVIP